MKLKLHVTKHYTSKSYLNPRSIRFAIVDLDKSKNYPSNYVCMLPRQVYTKAKVQSKFVQKYENQSLKIAKRLLNQALKTTDDQEIKQEIRKRLRLLAPKQKNLVKCKACGKEFKARRYGYRFQKTCYGCLNKLRSSQTV